MAVYVVDSSALVKRYVRETGTAWVRGLTDPAAGHIFYIAGITGVEVVSALTRQTRSGALAPTDAAQALAQFRQDFAHQYPTFKGVRYAAVNFAPLPLLDTRPDQCPRLRRRADDGSGFYGPGGLSYSPRQIALALPGQRGRRPRPLWA